MSRPTKEQLIQHYKSRQPNLFRQIDAYDDLEGNELVQPDDEGHSIFDCETYELMDSSTVRVLVRPGTNKDTVVALLEKIKEQIEEEEEAAQAEAIERASKPAAFRH